MPAFSYTASTMWRPTGRRRHFPLAIREGRFDPSRTVMVLEFEMERMEWRESVPRDIGAPPPANAVRVTKWREARLGDLIPIEEGVPA